MDAKDANLFHLKLKLPARSDDHQTTNRVDCPGQGREHAKLTNHYGVNC